MTDTLSPEKRSWNMSRIRGRDTGPEKQVRSILHRLGYRFRLNRAHLPGKPDIVLPKHRTVVFVHGCYWHRHPGCKKAYTPKTSKFGPDFWQKKFARNVERDREVKSALEDLGWRVLYIWECETKDTDALAMTLKTLLTQSEANSSINDTAQVETR